MQTRNVNPARYDEDGKLTAYGRWEQSRTRPASPEITVYSGIPDSMAPHASGKLALALTFNLAGAGISRVSLGTCLMLHIFLLAVPSNATIGEQRDEFGVPVFVACWGAAHGTGKRMSFELGSDPVIACWAREILADKRLSEEPYPGDESELVCSAQAAEARSCA